MTVWNFFYVDDIEEVDNVDNIDDVEVEDIDTFLFLDNNQYRPKPLQCIKHRNRYSSVT